MHTKTSDLYYFKTSFAELDTKLKNPIFLEIWEITLTISAKNYEVVHFMWAMCVLSTGCNNWTIMIGINGSHMHQVTVVGEDWSCTKLCKCRSLAVGRKWKCLIREYKDLIQVQRCGGFVFRRRFCIQLILHSGVVIVLWLLIRVN